MGTKKGNLSIDSENIFPIIKKWVYSDHDSGHCQSGRKDAEVH